MNEGAYRVLRALARQRESDFAALVRISGEAESVVRDVLGTYAQWFQKNDAKIQCTQVGWAAYGQERAAREGFQDAADAELIAQFEDMLSARSEPKRALDQVYATGATAIRRAKLLLERGEHQRGTLFLGDDDLTALALHLLAGPRSITTLDIDDDVLNLTQEKAAARGWEHKVIKYDVREPVPAALRGKYGCVFCDPPYAEEGFRTFVSRAVEFLKPDGTFYVCFGQSRRALERGLKKQRVLMDTGLLIEQVMPEFNEYQGAKSIGSRSSLWICKRTAQTSALESGRYEGELYSTRSQEL